MPRLARVIVPDCPHHVTQRGDRREPISFEDGDQDVNRGLLAEQTRKRGVEVWADCLTPNHVHLIVVPSDERGLGLAVGEAHRRYTHFINVCGGWSGHLFSEPLCAGLLLASRGEASPERPREKGASWRERTMNA
jgi:putative transposase